MCFHYVKVNIAAFSPLQSIYQVLRAKQWLLLFFENLEQFFKFDYIFFWVYNLYFQVVNIWHFQMG